MVEILQKLGYAPSIALENENTNHLLNLMWDILTLNKEAYHEPGVTERNLVIFI